MVDEDPDGGSASFEFNLRFPGLYFDAETGLHQNYYRDYDPSLGRYLQSDPIGIMRDFSDPQLQAAISLGIDIRGRSFSDSYIVPNNIYGYAGQNPSRFIDLFGLYKQVFPGQNEDDVPDDNPDNPDPDFPDEKDEKICSLKCSNTYIRGVKRCKKSCKGPNFYSQAVCQQSWSTWLTNCRISCALK